MERLERIAAVRRRWAMDASLVDLVIEIVAGAVGGYLAGVGIRTLSLGTAGDLIAGIIGGVLVGLLVRLNMPGLGSAAAGVSVVAVIGQVVAAFVGGAILAIIVGFGKDMLSPPRPS
jgi:hypothetical protein